MEYWEQKISCAALRSYSDSDTYLNGQKNMIQQDFHVRQFQLSTYYYF